MPIVLLVLIVPSWAYYPFGGGCKTLLMFANAQGQSEALELPEPAVVTSAFSP